MKTVSFRVGIAIAGIALLQFLAGTALAQSGKLFTVDNELSSSLINYVYQDHRQVIWIATVDGLNRYDGSKFTHYKRKAGDSTSLHNNYVRVLFEDSHQRLYVGFFNGLQYYDYATDTFHDVPLVLSDGNPYPAHVLSLVERSNGDVLIATSGHGVFIVKERKQKIEAHQAIELSPSYMVSNLYEDSHRNLWVATQDKGLFGLKEDGHFKNYLSSAESGTISSLCEDGSSTLYAGSATTGLYAYDPKQDEFDLVPFDQPLSINKLHYTRSGEMLVGTERDGLKIFDPESKTISDGNFSVSTLDFSRSKVHSILEDSKGNIWLGIHQKGVALLPFKSNNFHYYGYKSITNNVIGSHMVTAVYTDRNGIRWVGTDGDGIYGLRPDGEPPLHFYPKTHPGVPATILSIIEDSSGNLWLGSYDRGLVRLNLNNGRGEDFNHLLEKHNAQQPRIFAMREDQDKNIWIATMGSGLYCLNIQTMNVDHWAAPQGADYQEHENTLHSDWVCSLDIIRGKLFIGTVDGMGCMDLRTRSFNTTFGRNRLIPGIIVNAFSEGQRNNVWVGTAEGLISLDTNTGKWVTYTMKEGLPSNVICAVQKDVRDNLWISTNFGISRLNQNTGNFLNYYSDDGLQGNEFSRGAVEIDKNGTISFGGINGITIFNPSEISNEQRSLNVRLTGFYIHNNSVTKGMTSDGHQIVDTSVMEADEFNISQKDNSFTIEFSCMEFVNPERIRYMYRLNEQDEWIVLPAGTNNVTFSNLSPGTYSFKVRAKDHNALSAEKIVSIVIHPVWYFSATARVIYFLFFALIAGLFVHLARQRQRAKRKMLEHLHAEQIKDAKLQFFINIAHEIRTPMSLIISPLKRLIARDVDKERQRSYMTMSQNSERIVRLINQLMDIQKIDKGQMILRFQETEMVDYIRHLCLAFKEEVYSRKINLRLTHDAKEITGYIDPDNFDKVILNVLANALKFTPEGGDVNIHASVLEDLDPRTRTRREFIQITIRDAGIGIAEAELKKVFDCFYQTKESKHISREGTGIGLHLTRSIIELHDGHIWAENNTNAPGCCFFIRIPTGMSHLEPEDIVTEADLPHHTDIAEHIHGSSISTPEVKVKSKHKQRVLVVDDDKGIREYLCTEMGSDYHMAKCADGKEALTYILNHPPDLIITDIKMPEMDGITLCRKVKQNVNINHIPVVMLTARKGEESNLEGLAIGADAYIVKPFNIEIVRKTVQNIIRNREILRNNYTGNQLQHDKIRDIEVKSPDEKLLGRIMDIINSNISNQRLSVEMLAHEIGISRVHLHRKLKELTNQSTRDLIRNIRLQQAAKLLAEKHLNISEVAFAVGFSNVAHFSTAFKELYGVSPMTYMDEQRDR